MTASRPPINREDAGRHGQIDPAEAKPGLLVVRRNKRMAGWNLLAASIAFGVAVAAVWYAWQEGAGILGPLFLLVLVTTYGISAGQQFRDESPKLVVELTGLSMPGIAAAPIAWRSIEEISVTTGLRAIGGGRVDVVVDAETFARLRLGSRWLGDPIVRKPGPRAAFSLVCSALDSPARVIHTAMRHHWEMRR